MTGDKFTRNKLAWLEQVADDIGQIGALGFRVAFEISRHWNRATGDAYPGQDRIARQCGVTNTAARNALAKLKENGHLTVTLGNGRGSTNRYRPILKEGGKTCDAGCTFPQENLQSQLHLSPQEDATPLAPLAEEGATTVSERCNVRCEEGATYVATNTLNEHYEEHTEQIALRKKASKKKVQLPLLRFPEFWTAYPLKVGKQDAHVAYVGAIEGGASEADIIKGAIRYHASKAGEDRKFLKHPSGWLNSKRWLDEPDTKANGRGGAQALPLDTSTWDAERWKSAVLVAKRSGKWPSNYGPTTKIPAELIDSDLAAIIRRAGP